MQASMKIALALMLSQAEALKISSDASIATKDRPVTKIVNMLKNMQETLEQEKESDEDLYNKLTCWCKEARKATGDNVNDAQARITELKSKVEQLSATVSSCESAMDQLRQQISTAEAASDEARVLRGKQYEKFKEDDQTYNEDIYAVESAATVLGDTGSLLQIPGGQTPEQLVASLQKMMSRRADKLDDALSFADRDMINAFIKDPKKFVQNKASFLQSSNGEESRGEPATTFKLMAEDFEKDQKEMQEAEKIAKTNFEELIAAKKVEIKAGEKSREKKRSEKADAKNEMFKASVEIKDREKAIKAAAEFAKVMESKCSTSDEEWEVRSKGRAEEIEAVGKAIQILDADEAHATFGRTYSFIQLSSEESRIRSIAVSTLSKLGNKFKDHRLVALANNAKLDSFTKVRAAIDEMTVALKKEAQDEVDQKQFCTDSFNKNTAAVVAEKDAKAGFENKGSQLKEKLNVIASEVEKLNAQVAEAQKEMKLATENRAAEKADFEKTAADQQSTQVLLKKALETLRGVYQEKPSMIQKPEVPEGFKEYKKNKNSFSVMSLMQQLIAETTAMEAEAKRDEKNAEDTYNKEMQAQQGTVDSLNQGLATQNDDKAKTTKALMLASKSFEGSKSELADLAQEEANLHASCDFLLKNWDLRVSARNEEIDSLAQAKHTLSGGK
eukprot:TRINITY_DN2041_c0_g1_i3.p1 TRINITY_DN2041_c0_g1~~TRINITY_DN2041_c0_g1_i3.p1  ORF type:complete len:673 (-),score=251.07 TRINITY_DN2041_c0_g1_i3:182-2200(-)